MSRQQWKDLKKRQSQIRKLNARLRTANGEEFTELCSRFEEMDLDDFVESILAQLYPEVVLDGISNRDYETLRQSTVDYSNGVKEDELKKYYQLGSPGNPEAESSIAGTAT